MSGGVPGERATAHGTPVDFAVEDGAGFDAGLPQVCVCYLMRRRARLSAVASGKGGGQGPPPRSRGRRVKTVLIAGVSGVCVLAVILALLIMIVTLAQGRIFGFGRAE